MFPYQMMKKNQAYQTYLNPDKSIFHNSRKSGASKIKIKGNIDFDKVREIKRLQQQERLFDESQSFMNEGLDHFMQRFTDKNDTG